MTRGERVTRSARAQQESKQNVSADGTSDDRGLANADGIEHTGDVAGVFLHQGRAFANLRITVPAQVGKNQLVARIERGRHRRPEFVMTRKRMEKNDRRALPPNFIEDFRIVAAQAFHGRRIRTQTSVPVETQRAASGLAPRFFAGSAGRGKPRLYN